MAGKSPYTDGVTIRMRPETLAWFKARAEAYMTTVSDLLRIAAEAYMVDEVTRPQRERQLWLEDRGLS